MNTLSTMKVLLVTVAFENRVTVIFIFVAIRKRGFFLSYERVIQSNLIYSYIPSISILIGLSLEISFFSCEQATL